MQGEITGRFKCPHSTANYHIQVTNGKGQRHEIACLFHPQLAGSLAARPRLTAPVWTMAQMTAATTAGLWAIQHG